METDEEILDYLNKLAKSLTSNADYEGEFEICMINSKAINAFAAPGGLICFNSGLIMETQTEAEVHSPEAHSTSYPKYTDANVAPIEPPKAPNTLSPSGGHEGMVGQNPWPLR